MPYHLETLRQYMGSAGILSDAPSITAYSVDAGIYKLNPKCIVLVESGEDLESVLKYSQDHHVPLTARSGGTNLTGNAIGEGIILEFSRLNQLLELNISERWARVQPGITYSELNKRLTGNGLMFGPDPSSGDMCKIGGMIGNNSAGPHSLKYGSTKDNVLEMQILLANGNWIHARDYRINDPEFEKLARDNPFIKTLLHLIQENIPLILEKKKKVSKNSSGYNLFALAEGVSQGAFPLHQLFVGSEGTLGLLKEAKIRLVRRPDETGTALLYFNSLTEMSQAVNDLLTLSPSALEMMDRNTLDLIGRKKYGIPPQAQAMLLAEFDHQVSDRMERLKRIMAGYKLSSTILEAYDSEKQAQLWKARKAINPALYQYDPYKKPIHFVDDVVVPVNRIPDLIPYLENLFREKNVVVAIYGHIGDGNAHINPLLNLNDPADFSNMVSLSKEIHETVIGRFNGSLCGEHGDGRVRSEFLKELYGPAIYELFKRVKNGLDPDQLFNPGVKISETPFTEHIDFERYTKPCATCGKCNSVCPVYDVKGEESNSARGWFHIVTDPAYSYETSGRAIEACLNCKSCRTVCPAGIDVSELILKKREEHPNRLAKSFFTFQSKNEPFSGMLKWAAWTQPLWDNRVVRLLIEYLTLPWIRQLAQTARISASISLPRLAKRTLRERHSELSNASGPVAYFHGCAANYFDDGVGDSVIRLLRQNGINPALPPQRCSGTPIQTYGLTEQLRENARFNLNSLKDFGKVITGCASCTFMLKDYGSVFPDGAYRDMASNLASRVLHISEFLESAGSRSVQEQPGKKRRVTYHSSCHLRAAGVTREPKDLLRRHPDLEYVEMDDADRCAGGAGTFCMKNPELSRDIFRRKERAIIASGAEIVATSCPACMIQLRSGLRGKAEVKHIAQLL